MEAVCPYFGSHGTRRSKKLSGSGKITRKAAWHQEKCSEHVPILQCRDCCGRASLQRCAARAEAREVLRVPEARDSIIRTSCKMPAPHILVTLHVEGHESTLRCSRTGTSCLKSWHCCHICVEESLMPRCSQNFGEGSTDSCYHSQTLQCIAEID